MLPWLYDADFYFPLYSIKVFLQLSHNSCHSHFSKQQKTGETLDSSGFPGISRSVSNSSHHIPVFDIYSVRLQFLCLSAFCRSFTSFFPDVFPFLSVDIHLLNVSLLPFQHFLKGMIHAICIFFQGSFGIRMRIDARRVIQLADPVCRN